MFVIKVKDSDRYVCRKPYKLAKLDDTQTYRSKGAAKTALNATTDPIILKVYMKDLGITEKGQLEIREVGLVLKD